MILVAVEECSKHEKAQASHMATLVPHRVTLVLGALYPTKPSAKPWAQSYLLSSVRDLG